jgi:exopolysaccharide biosynthesis polyprenyl glycosylphosphotransferase
VFDRHKQKAAILFAIADVLLTVCAFEAAYQTRVTLPLERVFFIIAPMKALLLGATLLLWVGIGSWIGAYRRFYGNDGRAAVYDSFLQVLLGTIGLVTFQFLLRLDLSRVFIGLFAAYSLTLLLFYRLLAGRVRGYIRRQFGAEVFYVVVGSGERALEMGRRLERTREYGTRLLAFVDPSGSADQPVRLNREYPVKALSELPAMLRRHVIDEIIFTVAGHNLAELEEIFLLCDEEGIKTRVVMDLFPHVNSRVYLEGFGDIPLLTFSTTPHDELRLFVKRIIDVLASAAALLVMAVPMGVLAALVRLTSKGPAIFRQERCGLNGRRFVFYKLRSMVENAEDLKTTLEHLNEKDGPVFKISNDPRLTPIGRYLRRYSIDEWPQLWNVLRGDMSLVGPRPAVPSEIDRYQAWQRRRLRMRPGLTCLWAIKGRDAIGFDTWMKLDLEYIDRWSLWLDLKIILQTIPRVVAGRGAS